MTVTCDRPLRRALLSPVPRSISTFIPRSRAVSSTASRSFFQSRGTVTSTPRISRRRSTICSMSTTSTPARESVVKIAEVTPGRSLPVRVMSSVSGSLAPVVVHRRSRYRRTAAVGGRVHRGGMNATAGHALLRRPRPSPAALDAWPRCWRPASRRACAHRRAVRRRRLRRVQPWLPRVVGLPREEVVDGGDTAALRARVSDATGPPTRSTRRVVRGHRRRRTAHRPGARCGPRSARHRRAARRPGGSGSGRPTSSEDQGEG